MKSLVLAGFLTLLGAASCGSKSYNYTFQDDTAGCETGKKVFSSFEEMCKQLQSDSYNSSCALKPRMDFFTSEGCAGTFVESP
jgi:hypothetical protein